MQRLDIEQGSIEWIEARRGIPTASEFGRFVTPKRGDLSAQAEGYMADLIVETIDFDPEEQFRSYWMDRGLILEPEAADWYEFRYDTPLERLGLILNLGAGYSPDRVVGPKGAVEIKCPAPKTHVKWLLDGGLPDEHKPQVHGGLLIGELDWIDFVSYCPKYKPLVIRVTPDEYTTKVEAALNSFLEKYEAAKQRIFA